MKDLVDYLRDKLKHAEPAEPQTGREPFGIDYPEAPGYWIEIHPDGWPHRRIPVTPGHRLLWVPWGGDGPVPPFPPEPR